jgi:putative tricarboxylic transport membrane protein
MTGGFLIGVAALALFLSAKLSTFTGLGLGSGFLPRLFSVLLLGFGGLLIGRAFLTPDLPADSWYPRSWWVLVSIAFFALAIEPMGLAISVMGLVLISALGHRGTRLRESVSLAIGATLFCWLIFVKALGLTIPLWPQLA